MLPVCGLPMKLTLLLAEEEQMLKDLAESLDETCKLYKINKDKFCENQSGGNHCQWHPEADQGKKTEVK